MNWKLFRRALARKPLDGEFVYFSDYDLFIMRELIKRDIVAHVATIEAAIHTQAYLNSEPVFMDDFNETKMDLDSLKAMLVRVERVMP